MYIEQEVCKISLFSSLYWRYRGLKPEKNFCIMKKMIEANGKMIGDVRH
jgi:hypothetical protein